MLAQSVKIQDESDILTSRRLVREIATKIGFGLVDQTKLATATSELSRNIYRYADNGIVYIEQITQPPGIKVLFEDNGPGIADPEEAMKEGFSTTPGSLGLGLSGAKRLVDDMTIESEVGKGTKIEIFKYLP